MENGIKQFFEKRARYWYVVAAIIIVLVIADYGFLSMAIPLWACNVIMIVLIILATAYIAIMYNYVRQKCKNYMADRQEDIFERIKNLQEHIDELEKQSYEIIGAIEQTDADIKKEMEETAESQRKDLLSNIMSTQSLIKDEVRNLADNAHGNMEQISKLVVTKADESRVDQEKARQQIQARIEESDKATEILASDIAQTIAAFKVSTGQDAEHIVQAVGDIGTAIVTRIGEKKVEDELAYEQVKQQIISSEKNIVGNSNAIGDKGDSNSKVLERRLGELEQKVDGSIDNANSCTARIVEKIEVSGTDQKKTISEAEEHIISNADAALAYARAGLGELSDAVNNGNLACEERIGNAEDKITSVIGSAAADGKTEMEKIISEISSVKAAQSESDSIREKQFKNLETAVGDIVKMLSSKADELSNNTSAMQNELAKLMIQLLDDQEEDAQKAKSASDGIFNQIVRFSNATKEQIETLQDGLESGRQLMEAIKSTAEYSANEQYSQTSLLNDKVDTYSKVNGNNQKVIFTQLDHLQEQVANLNSLAGVIKSLAAAQHQGGQAAVSEKKGPDRTEEIRDPETGVTVFNHYKNNKLISSEMRKGKQKTYEVEYNEQGRIIHSRNFDANGLVNTDLQFYPNGQVKTRTERVTVDGKVMTVTSQFDEKGNKKE